MFIKHCLFAFSDIDTLCVYKAHYKLYYNDYKTKIRSCSPKDYMLDTL